MRCVRSSLLVALCCLCLLGCRKEPAAAVAPISEESQRLVGTWIGGGMLAPVYHTFSQDGTYVREAYVREAPELVERATGMWKLDGTKLTRSLGKAETVDEIVKSDKDFFQIRTKDGSTWGYNRRAARGH